MSFFHRQQTKLWEIINNLNAKFLEGHIVGTELFGFFNTQENILTDEIKRMNILLETDNDEITKIQVEKEQFQELVIKRT
jgi:hypothetical protein